MIMETVRMKERLYVKVKTTMSLMRVFLLLQIASYLYYNTTHNTIEPDDTCILCVSDESERQAYMESVNSVVGIVHEIDRSGLFEDVIDLYREGEIVGRVSYLCQV